MRPWLHFGMHFGWILGWFSRRLQASPAKLWPYESIGPVTKIKGPGLHQGKFLETKTHPKINQKINQNSDGFWEDFETKMRGVFDSKIGPKINVFFHWILVGFWIHFGEQNASKMASKNRLNLMWFLARFFERKCFQNGRPGEPKGEPERQPKSKESGTPLPGAPRGRPGHQNGTKMIPKWGPKWTKNVAGTYKFGS